MAKKKRGGKLDFGAVVKGGALVAAGAGASLIAGKVAGKWLDNEYAAAAAGAVVAGGVGYGALGGLMKNRTAGHLVAAGAVAGGVLSAASDTLDEWGDKLLAMFDGDGTATADGGAGDAYTDDDAGRSNVRLVI